MKARTHKNSTKTLPCMGVDYSDEPLTVVNDDLSAFRSYPEFDLMSTYRIYPATLGKSVSWEQMFSVARDGFKSYLLENDPVFFEVVFGPLSQMAYNKFFAKLGDVIKSAASVLTSAGIKPCCVQLELHAIGKVGRISLTVRKLKHFGGM